MQKTDSLGVPQNPPERKRMLVDDYGKPIYVGDQYYTDNGNVYAPSSLFRYTEDYVQSLTLAETWEMLQDIMKAGQTEELLKNVLYEEILARGVLTTFDLEEVQA